MTTETERDMQDLADQFEAARKAGDADEMDRINRLMDDLADAMSFD